ncbi:MAG: 30S ribosomal protein S16 [Candidatus Levybacteria bacterium CG_4_10_14_0_2_um_filter_36_16]|nr:MAG: 30S ribosomal protein S16 [Candidatus Levybacteria bacterium CG2_30_37_29]PIR79646.1 MAG: 30S ribosomal protein S16 [Candidatus Levybacteria bacterium CG10_big_fil_rev_8_21_14_0_10_36_30]PIZ97752.1 MAG: 30S ribosomal protein S16 [Candidatus Levybacteria bacterium CG_4_10_14_0_2_um_filter_36_16]PJA90620.1 MAG: 30S ribosomal protein S16 [Candidatus Levybacteria bacterium CG_4_9_14_3_um_filter_36_7]
MSLVIRFSTIGRRGERKYRIVVKEKRSKRDGKALDTLGFYEKMVGGKISKEIDQKKLLEWQKKGALLSPSVKKALAL